MKRNHNHRYAIRVIAATHHLHKTVKGLTNQRGDLTHNVSLMIIGVTTLIILVSSILRSIICFQGRMMYFTSPVGSPAVMYVFWGALEFGVNLLYIIGRVDLGFTDQIDYQKMLEMLLRQNNHYILLKLKMKVKIRSIG